MIPVHEKDGVTIYRSHSIFVLLSMPGNSVDSIVTDPPYGMSFMGKKWDYDVPSVQLWREALRVLKPGGHLLSFAGSRTYHRMVVNIEDAGFEIRDQIMWIYGSGFPKSLDVSKAIDKAAGVEREVVGEYRYPDGNPRNTENHKTERKGIYSDIKTDGSNNDRTITAPATTEAKQWDGWGTALKPAHEPIVVARKPLIGTVAENVLKHGTGGINIDGGRIEGAPWKWGKQTDIKGGGFGSKRPSDGDVLAENVESNSKGRFPANIILDPEAGAILDKQSGELTSGAIKAGTPYNHTNCKTMGDASGVVTRDFQADSGAPSRFFYCAKASNDDRNDGIKNNHPTVKPTELMQYLVRLITPPQGTVLDPFMGSGSTGRGAVREKFKFIGIERENEYIDIAIARINAPTQIGLL